MPNSIAGFPSFHDGYLTKIELSKKSAEVDLQHYDGTRYRLYLSEIEGMLANEFREGNIIFSLEVTTGTAPDVRDLRLLWSEPHPSVAAEYREQDVMFVERQRSKIERGEAVWVNLIASYGCNLVAVCKSVELVAVNVDIDCCAGVQNSN